MMRLKTLQSRLQEVEGFEDPNLQLEQYLTTPHIAAHMLYSIQMEYGDIEGRSVLDLGCGTGMLSIAAALLGACYCLGVDIDASALKILQQNVDNTETESVVEVLCCDVQQLHGVVVGNKFDVAIINPPFGTKRVKNTDIMFVKTALQHTNTVYSLHKTAHLRSIKREMKKDRVKVQAITQVTFDLSNTYSNHRQQSVDVQVLLLRFSK